MIDPKLIEILRCPETLQTVRLAEPAALAALNRQIAAGSIATRSGKLIREPVEAGLVRADGQFLYPIHQDIPVMLADEAIPLGTVIGSPA